METAYNLSVVIDNERFTDIHKSIPGITPKALTKELKEPEQRKMIKRVAVNDHPVKILYKSEPFTDTPTPIDALQEWSLNHCNKIFNKD